MERTVDGRNSANQLRLVVYLTIYIGFTHPRWLGRFLKKRDLQATTHITTLPTRSPGGSLPSCQFTSNTKLEISCLWILINCASFQKKLDCTTLSFQWGWNSWWNSSQIPDSHIFLYCLSASSKWPQVERVRSGSCSRIVHSLASEAEACKQIWPGQAYHLCMHVQHFVHWKINIHIVKYNELHICDRRHPWYNWIRDYIDNPTHSWCAILGGLPKKKIKKKTHPGETFHTQTHPWWRCRESPATNLQGILRHLYVRRVRHANPWSVWSRFWCEGKAVFFLGYFFHTLFWQRFLRKRQDDVVISCLFCIHRSLVVNAFFVHVHNKVTTPTLFSGQRVHSKPAVSQNHLLEIISRQPQNWEDGESSQSHFEKSVKL